MVLTAVADERGRVLAATDPRRVPMDSDIAALAGDAVALDNLSVDGASPVVSLLAPLTYQGRTVGQIATELDVSDLLSERRQALLFLIMGNAIAIGLLSTVGFLAIRWMLKPVTTLARQMTETQGEPHPIPASDIPQGDGEISRAGAPPTIRWLAQWRPKLRQKGALQNANGSSRLAVCHHHWRTRSTTRWAGF